MGLAAGDDVPDDLGALPAVKKGEQCLYFVRASYFIEVIDHFGLQK